MDIQRVLVTLLLLVVPALSIAFAADDSPDKDWKEYTPKGAGFSIKMPAMPMEDEVPAGGKERIKVYKYVLPENGGLYQAGYNEITGNAEQASAKEKDKLLDSNRDSSIKIMKGKLLKENKISLEKYPGRDVFFEAEEGKLAGRFRTYLVKNRLYHLLII